MIRFFTLTALICAAVLNCYAQCSVGGNGVVANTNITVNGDMADWTLILNDPDNITYDAIPDTDAPISDVGRDFTRFAFTENISTLFLYFQRAGSTNNSVDLLFYLDVNNNGFMQTNEPVVAISWSGSNGNTQVDVYNYRQVATGGDPVSGDGYDMPGSLSLRVKLGNLGKGSMNGVSLEVGIPFTQLYKQGTTSSLDSLGPIDQFKFHISSVNGSVASVPGPNSVNDNFGGCFSGFMTLPVTLEYLEGDVIKNDVLLRWKVSDNENAAIFDIEESDDGKNFATVGIVFAAEIAGASTYTFTAAIHHTKSYFRLKVTDKDKSATHSKAIVVSATNAHNALRVNNPFHNDLIIRYDATEAGHARLRVYNFSGSMIYSHQDRVSRGNNLLVVPDKYLNAKGTYIIEITNEDNYRAVQKTMKL